MVFLRVCLIYFIFGLRTLLGQESTVDLATQQGKAYSLEAQFGLEEYHMLAVVSVEASPDSELLFTSKINMEVFQSGDLYLESFVCDPVITSDDRENASNGKELRGFGGHPFSFYIFKRRL